MFKKSFRDIFSSTLTVYVQYEAKQLDLVVLSCSRKTESDEENGRKASAITHNCVEPTHEPTWEEAVMVQLERKVPQLEGKQIFLIFNESYSITYFISIVLIYIGTIFQKSTSQSCYISDISYVSLFLCAIFW